MTPGLIAPVVIPGTIRARRGPLPIGDHAMTPIEHVHKHRKRKREQRLQHIAVLDMETDPFDPRIKSGGEAAEIQPFCAELYSDQFGSIVIWELDHETLIEKLLAAIQSLPDSYTIYAHNGGKFDFMFFVSRLRGIVRFKGRAIMSAKIGPHELRDSLHILPEKLAAWKKDRFDYKKMLKRNRTKFRDEILTYLHSDCLYLFDFVRRFTKEFGLKISIGQAAFTELRKHYATPAIKGTMDAVLRPYFLGGRVECIAGQGLFETRHISPYKLYDVNSMYPFVMATRKHPIGPDYIWHRGEVNENTVFLDISCKSYGAMFQRLDTGELNSDDCEGRFYTTIWEYEAALRLGLIENVQINWCVDNLERTDFSKFIVPMYDRREETKRILKRLETEDRKDTPEYEEIKKENIFLKYLQNNAYGKFAQNPAKYKEYCYTDHGIKPEKSWFEFMNGADDDTRHSYGMPIERTDSFDVWARPSPGRRFNNVGTAASITGAARAKLLDARQNSVDAIYCDTDSLICRELQNMEIDATKLGAWDLEEIFDAVIITGKKTYCCKVAGRSDGHEARLKVRSKGADLRIRPEDRDGFEISEATEEQWQRANAATWNRYLSILDGQTITTKNHAPTFDKAGRQEYLTRKIRATAPVRSKRVLHTRLASSV